MNIHERNKKTCHTRDNFNWQSYMFSQQLLSVTIIYWGGGGHYNDSIKWPKVFLSTITLLTDDVFYYYTNHLFLVLLNSQYIILKSHNSEGHKYDKTPKPWRSPGAWFIIAFGTDGFIRILCQQEFRKCWMGWLTVIRDFRFR